MNTMNNRNRLGLAFPAPLASAGDELSLLVNLVQTEKIGVKMLLQNVTEILTDDPSLLVDVVLLITDPKRINESEAHETDYVKALISVKRATDLKGQEVLENAISHAAAKAGFIALPS
jgi:intracellular sulfur oxidation DsrE/DsrF family protein